MNAARRSDGLLGGEGACGLLQLIADQARPLPEVARIAHAAGLGSPSRAVNSLRLHVEMGLAHDDGDAVGVTPRGRSLIGDLVGFRGAVADHYRTLLSGMAFGPLFQRDPGTGAVLVDAVLLPFREIGLPFLLLDLGIVERDEGRAWRIANDLQDGFLGLLSVVNASQGRSKPLSPAGLEAWIANRKAAGFAAEAFALEFERGRLAGHPLLDQVRWIAEEDVGAGYDIHAFEDLRSLLLDRHIEVKGHGGDRTFHWSTGEIAAAREKRQAYWLYLVDRRLIGQVGYEPEMYCDPYTYFIEENPMGWVSEPTSFQFVPPA